MGLSTAGTTGAWLEGCFVVGIETFAIIVAESDRVRVRRQLESIESRQKTDRHPICGVRSRQQWVVVKRFDIHNPIPPTTS
jgi:hypothetical protein